MEVKQQWFLVLFYPYDSKMAFLYEMHIYSAEDGIHLM